jgi:glycosyltransferase involved in cell wall biosynthesis
MQKTIVQILRAPAGGIRKHVLDILENISNEKMQQVFITNIKDSDIDLNFLTENPHIEILNIEIQESPGISDFVNMFTIFNFLKHRDITVVHGHGAKGGLYARVLGRLLHAKTVYTPHGGSLHRIHGAIKNLIFDLVEKLLVPLTDIFLFESIYTADVFSKNIADPGTKKIINYNGVEIPKLKATQTYIAGNKLKIASFGLLRELKGHDIFIKTCHLLKTKNIPFHYTIYGAGEFEAVLRDLITKFKLENEVTILNYSSSVCDEMLKFDFIVHPSRFESFGYVPVEAMSMLIPVIVSHVGGLQEVVSTDSGYISIDNTPESYLEIVSKIFNGDPSLDQKINNGVSRVENMFSKEKMLSVIEKVYLS